MALASWVRFLDGVLVLAIFCFCFCFCVFALGCVVGGGLGELYSGVLPSPPLVPPSPIFRTSSYIWGNWSWWLRSLRPSSLLSCPLLSDLSDLVSLDLVSLDLVSLDLVLWTLFFPHTIPYHLRSDQIRSDRLVLSGLFFLFPQVIGISDVVAVRLSSLCSSTF